MLQRSFSQSVQLLRHNLLKNHKNNLRLICQRENIWHGLSNKNYRYYKVNDNVEKDRQDSSKFKTTIDNETNSPAADKVLKLRWKLVGRQAWRIVMNHLLDLLKQTVPFTVWKRAGWNLKLQQRHTSHNTRQSSNKHINSMVNRHIESKPNVTRTRASSLTLRS